MTDGIIDAHNHPDWHGYTLDKTLANMDRCGIERTWLLTWECPDDEYDPVYNHHIAPPVYGGPGPIPLSHVVAWHRHAPDRFVPGFAPDPRRPDAIDRLQAAVDHYGVRVCGELKVRMMVDNPDALDLFRFCGEKGLPVIIHFDYPIRRKTRYPRPHYWYSGGIDALERVLQACPNTVFLGHAPGFWAHISGDDRAAAESYPTGPVVPGGRVPELLRKYPNLWCDLSAGSGYNALARDKDHAVRFINEFQDRLLFARDYFDTRLYDLLMELDLTDEVRRKIFRENAERLLAVSEDGGAAG